MQFSEDNQWDETLHKMLDCRFHFQQLQYLTNFSKKRIIGIGSKSVFKKVHNSSYVDLKKT